MELILTLTDEARIDTIINDLEEGKKNRPKNYTDETTGYWRHHLSQIHIEKLSFSKIRVTGESGFYFPGATYSGLDYANTLFKRLTLMRWISRTRYDLSIPQVSSNTFGYRIFGKWIAYDFLRSISHAHRIISQTEKSGIVLPEEINILEIGSGTGIQALVFKLLFKNSTYFLVDFPETLALAQVFLSVVLPESKILFFDEWRKNPDLLNSGEYDFVFVPNYAVSSIPSNRVHLALNTVSMQEMNYQTIGMYFKHIRRILTLPSLFYQCNRDKKMDDTLIEVSKYPYTVEDVHLSQEPDPFYNYIIKIRKLFGRIPLLRSARIPIIRKGGKQVSYLTKMAKTELE